MAKKIMLYGSKDCPGCVAAKEMFEEKGLKYGYVDVLAGLAHLKKFLAIRDQNPDIYADCVENGRVGIPTLVVADERIYLGASDEFLKELEG